MVLPPLFLSTPLWIPATENRVTSVETVNSGESIGGSDFQNVFIHDNVPKRINGVAEELTEKESNEEPKEKNSRKWYSKGFVHSMGRGIKKMVSMGRTSTWIFEVAGMLREEMPKKTIVSLDYNSCKVYYYIDTFRCYRRHQLGHLAKKGSEKEDLCSWCGKSGHRRFNCEGKVQSCMCCRS